MLKNKIKYLLVIVALIGCIATLSFAQDTGPLPSKPVLKLAVTQSPLTVYPPIMIYTAQLVYYPTMSAAALKVEFYNSSIDSTADRLELIGTALVDKTGKAVISKQMKAGAYVAVARIVIGTTVIWSNRVEYKVN